jgi:hypothetical protein
MECSAFVADVAATTNSGEADAGKRWLLSIASTFLQSRGQPFGAWPAYDFAIYDFEAVGRAWPIMAKAAELMPDASAARQILPTLARFVAERLPAIWAREPWQRHEELTRAIVIADRSHDLVALFSVGMKPSGSKDPFALRRAANHWLMQVVCPLTVERYLRYDRVIQEG